MTKPKVMPKYNIINNMNDLKERDLTFNNVIKVNNNECIMVLSAFELGEAFENEDIVYLTTTQRGVKIVRCEEKPISSDKNIREMTELMKEDSLATSYITLAVPEGDLEYSDGILKINKEMLNMQKTI